MNWMSLSKFSRVFRVDLVLQKILVIAFQSIFHDRHRFEIVYLDLAKLFENDRNDWVNWLDILDLDVMSKIYKN
jgi:predicted membrane-bound mannosyltransferase